MTHKEKLEELKSLVRSLLQAQEERELCVDLGGLDCEMCLDNVDCRVLDGVADARSALQMWMKNHP